MDYGLPKYQEIEENVKIPLMEVDLAFGPEDGPIIVGRNDFDSFNKLIDTIGAKMAFVQYDWILPPGMCVDMEEYDIDELFGEDTLCFGLANDAIGYVVPDNDYAMALIAGHYQEMISLGKYTASTIMNGFVEIAKEVK